MHLFLDSWISIMNFENGKPLLDVIRITYLQRYHTTKIEVSKVFSKFKKIHWIFCHSTCLICHPTVTQIVFNETPPQMSLELLLWVFWHFWRYVEYFLELSESIGMHFETFWKLSDEFFQTSKKSFLSLATCGNF